MFFGKFDFVAIKTAMKFKKNEKTICILFLVKQDRQA